MSECIVGGTTRKESTAASLLTATSSLLLYGKSHLPTSLYLIQANKRIFERWVINGAFEIASSAVGNNEVRNAYG